MNTLEGIIKTYGAGLARVAASYEADAALQEDLLQEILIAIHHALPSLRDPGRLGPFVYRIAHNRAVTHIVRQKAVPQPREAPDVADPAATPEQRILDEERQGRVMKAVRQLPLPYRQVMTLVLEDLSHAEIAEALGLSPSNVGVRVNRAKVLLKDLLHDA
jgi:RNA polymerase sigma-70 factor (ECF subfamily)